MPATPARPTGLRRADTGLPRPAAGADLGQDSDTLPGHLEQGGTRAGWFLAQLTRDGPEGTGQRPFADSAMPATAVPATRVNRRSGPAT
jgi:hypothetical protein